MKFIPRLIAAAATALLAASAQAGVLHVYDITYDGSTPTYVQSAAGETLAVGDQVQLTIHTIGGYWSLASTAALWSPVRMVESGTRVGDLTASMLAGASIIETQSLAGGASSFVHIPQALTFGANNFDGFTWLYTLNSSDALSDTLGNLFNDSFFINFGQPVPVFVRGALPGGNVPEPTSVLLAGIGLAAAAAARRRKA